MWRICNMRHFRLQPFSWGPVRTPASRRWFATHRASSETCGHGTHQPRIQFLHSSRTITIFLQQKDITKMKQPANSPDRSPFKLGRAVSRIDDLRRIGVICSNGWKGWVLCRRPQHFVANKVLVPRDHYLKNQRSGYPILNQSCVKQSTQSVLRNKSVSFGNWKGTT